MRREELVMEIIGGLDDRFITEAMPSHGSQERAADTRAVAAVTPVEDIGEISKKDRVIYWVTHSLGVAAAAILIIGAAVLLIMNWDKIAVSRGERPGTIVKYIDELPDISEAYGKTIEFSDASVRLSSATYDGTSLNARFYILFKGSDDVPYPGLWINVEGEECAPSYAAEPVMEADSYNYIVHSFVRVSLEPGRAYVVNIEYLGNGNRESDTQEYRFTCPNVTAVTTADTTNDPYLTTTVEALIEPDTADRFGQITDTSMPRPFPEWHDYDNLQFESQWKTKTVGAAMDCRGRENYDEWDRMCMSIRTPYRLDDNNNVAGVIKQFGITSGEIDEYFEKRNAKWQESLEKAEESGNEGAVMNCRNEIFSDEEINALKSGNDAEIIALFISDYSIWLPGSNYVISPEWLYYHTAGDYAAIGITPQMMAAKIPLFEKTFTGTDNGEDLDEKSWELFKAKLTEYAESAEITDRLAVKTDSMPVPFKPVDSVAPGRMPFYALWQDKFGGDKTVSYIDLGYFFPASSDIAFDSAETPYNIENSYNDLRYTELLGLTNDEPGELIRRRNEIYRDNEGEMTYLDKFLYSDADIEVLLSGDRERIAKHFASDFAIVVGENVFSPQWLYYHTIDDYETAEIAPEAVRELLPRYEEAFTGEAAAMYANSWDVFKRKLTNYAYRETYSFRLAEITSGFDTELFEKSFYGKWEKDGGSSDDNGILLTYRDDMFTFENWIFPRGIAETDELYILPYINCGVGECYIIKKDAPDVLYKGWWNLASYGGGSDEKDVFIIITASDKYVIANRFENDRELHPGDEIGVWGLYKLMGNSAQSAIFSQFCLETGFEKTGGFNGSGSFTDENGVVWEIAGTKSLPPTNIYYIGGDGSHDLRLAVRYYEKTEFDSFAERNYTFPEPTEHYFILSFETEISDGGTVCNITRSAYSLPEQDDAAVIDEDEYIEEEVSSDIEAIIEDEEN